MAIDTGGSAFPIQELTTSTEHGMTLRDYFAAKAMPVLIIAEWINDHRETAEIAYAIADYMIEARKK